MAQLFRVSKLHDTSESQTFTFILPPAAALEYPPEILSRDFMYAGHKWRISLLKQERHLSPYLQMTSINEGVRCLVDFTFVLVHRQSFTESEQYAEKQREFNWRRSNHGYRTFVTLDDLVKRQFSDSKGEFLFEVVLKNPKTMFEQIFALNVIAKTAANDSRHCDNRDYQRYDTTPANFGEQEWICVFCPNMDKADNGSMRHMVQLNRRNRSDILSKLRYRIMLGPSESNSLRSETREEVFDFSGNGEAFYFTDDYFKYIRDGNRLQLTLEFYSISCVNHMKLNVLCTEKRPVAQCFDRDRQTWCITLMPKDAIDGRRRSRVNGVSELDADDQLSFTLLYPDVQNIPRNYLRYVSWSFHIIPSGKKRENTPTVQPITATALGAPFEHYYSQLETDNGFIMRTKLTLTEIKENSTKWLDEVDHRLTIQLEWLGSYLLLHPAYHAHDDIYRKHILQMRREVQALQAENNSLEKQVHDFQTTVNKGGTGSDTSIRPRTASASSTGTSIILQPPPPVAKIAQTPPMQHRNSTTSFDGLGGTDSRRPSRSISGVDMASTTTLDPSKSALPRQRSGSSTESKDYRNGKYDNIREEYEKDHLVPYSPTTSPPPQDGRSIGRSKSSANAPYFSPTKKPLHRSSVSDAPTIVDSRADSSPIRRVASSRSARSSRRDSIRYDGANDEMEINDRTEFLSAERSAYLENSTNTLVRSKSASPYPQRHQSMNVVNAYWRSQSPTTVKSDVDDGQEARYTTRHYSTTTVGQLRPEQTHFGEERAVNHQRHRSFRSNHHRERKLTAPRRSNHGREAEDIGDLDANRDAYYYR